MNIPYLYLYVASENTQLSIQSIVAWLQGHWLLLLIIFVAIILVMILIFSVIVPGIRKIIWKIKQRKETKKYSEELLLRKHLADVARGGKEGEEAEEQTLVSYLAEIRAEFSYAKSVFKKEHKSIYDSPWYIMVGEPGSGKSSLIRNSSLDMPPEIVDPAQGESGTSTFHWWFSSAGVIIDVGGRLFFNRWGGKGDSEWRYLISRIRKLRKKCPVNGIIVTIPADSLLADPHDLIKKKAKMIADEVGVLQRSLGLSLPVYVVVTKMDFVPGFSETFEHLDPEQRKKIFGLTPGNDSVFSQESLNEEFNSATEKLRKYVSARMLGVDALAADTSKRINSAKSIYVFPDAFLSLKDNLGLYMQSLFGLTNWSGNPLLLYRGVFFTASADMGIRFDKDVINITGHEYKIPKNKQPVISRSPAFIYDMFMSKIFPESQLVSFTSVAAARRRLPLLILSALLTVCAGLLIFFSLLDKRQLDIAAGRMKNHWNKIEKLFKNGHIQKSPCVVIDSKGQPKLLFFKPMDGMNDVSREGFLLSLYSQALGKYRVPVIYRFSQPWVSFYTDGLLRKERLDALQVAYAEMVFLPLLDSVRFKFLHNKNIKWTEADVNALQELLYMEVIRTLREKHDKKAVKGYKNFGFNTLFKFLFGCNFEDSKPKLAGNTYKKIFDTNKSELNIENPASSVFYLLNTGLPQSLAPLRKGIKDFCMKWETCSAEPNLIFHTVKDISGLLDKFSQTENRMDKIEKQFTLNSNMPSQKAKILLKQWQNEYKILSAIASKLQKYQQELAEDAELSPDNLLTKTAYQFSLKMHDAYNKLRNVIDKNFRRDKTSDKIIDEIYKILTESLHRAEITSQVTLMAIASNMHKYLYDWTKQEYSRRKAYLDRYFLYSLVSKKAAAKIPKVDLFNVLDKIDGMDKDAHDFLNYLNSQAKNAGKDTIFCDTIDDMKTVFLTAHKIKRGQCYMAALNSVPDNDKSLSEFIKKESATEEIIPAPFFPMTLSSANATFDNCFHPDAAAKYIKAWEKLTNKLITGKKIDKNFTDRPKILSKYREDFDVITSYKRKYVRYWTHNVLNLADVKAYPLWKNFIRDVSGLKTYQINGSIQYLARQCIYSLKNVPIHNSELKREVSDAILFYQKQLAILTPMFVRQSAICLESWQQMPDSPEECCAKIINMSTPELSQTLFGVYSVNPKSRLIWWNDFIDEAREALRNNIAKYVINKTRTLAGSYMQFPLCNMEPRSPAMTLAQLQIADIQIHKYLRVPPEVNTKSTSQKNDKNRINKLIDRIRPYYTLEDDNQREWFKKISEVMNVLNDNIKPLYWEMVLPPHDVLYSVPKKAEMLDAVPAAYRYRYFEVYLEGIKLGKRMPTATSDGKMLILPAIHGYASAQDLVFLFYEFVDSKKPGAVIAFKDNWAIINLYLRSEVVYDDKRKIHYVPFLFTDNKGYSCWFKVGIKFNRKVPMPSQWPTPDSWISFNIHKPVQKRDINRDIAIILQQVIEKEKKKKIINLIKSSTPAGAIPAWEFYIPSLKQQLRIPINTAGNIRRYFNLSDFSLQSAEVPNAGISLMRYLEIYAEGHKITRRLETLNPNPGKTRYLNVRIPLNTKNLEFHFFRYADDKNPAKIIKINKKYPVIEMLLSENTVIEPNKDGFLVPLKVKQHTITVAERTNRKQNNTEFRNKKLSKKSGNVLGKQSVQMDYYVWIGIRASKIYE